MRIGVVSDIHCNAPALKRAINLMGNVDEIFCLGDSIFEYRFSNEVVEILKTSGAHVIQGNHEEAFFSPAGVRARAAPGIDNNLADWLAAQPLRKQLKWMELTSTFAIQHRGNRAVRTLSQNILN